MGARWIALRFNGGFASSDHPVVAGRAGDALFEVRDRAGG
jgi:hypothetical protein